MSSQSTDDIFVRREIVKLENARKTERVERMVRDLQAAIISKVKDLEQKMEKKELEQKMEKKDLEQKMERQGLEQKMERMQAHLEQKMERIQAQAQAALEKKDLEQKMEKNERKQQITRMKADGMMRAALENEKRDRLLENEKRDRLLENEKRDREADKKEAQHQIAQLKWEARFSQMEQQQAARAYNIQLPTPLQHNAGTVLPLAPQREQLIPLQPTKLQELSSREEEIGPSHSMTPVTAPQPVLPGRTAISAAIQPAAQPDQQPYQH
jgi:hypothetical protein